MKRSIFSIILIVLAVASAVLVGMYYLYRGLSLRGINISIASASSTVQMGEPFTINVSAANNTKSALNNVRIVVDLPDGLMVASNHSERVLEHDISSFPSGGTFNQNYTLIAVTSTEAVQVLQAQIYYSPQSVVASFSKSTSTNISVAAPEISLNLSTATSTVYSGQTFAVTATYENNGSSTINNVRIKFNYPQGFTETSASPAPSDGGSAWNMGDATSEQVTVNGQVNLPDNSPFVMTASVMGNVDGQDYVIVSDSLNMTVAKSPLSLNISLNGGDPNQVVYPGETLNYVVAYTNNTPVTFNNLILSTQVSGGMINWGTLQSNGIMSNYGQTITWTPSTVSQLASLAPNSSGEVSFSFQLDSPYPVQYVNSKNFSVKIKAQASSPTVPYLIDAGQTKTVAISEAKVAGEIAVQSTAYFRDAASGAINNGPWPPKVGQSTEYTVHWSVSNYVTDVSNMTVSSVLPPGVVFVSTVQNYASSTFSYDPSTNSVIWQVGSLPATAGIITAAPQVVFQIAVTPQSSDVNNYKTILGETNAQATDDFSGIQLTASSSPITTLLPSDPSVSVGQGLVQQ